ncbi:hypothetical protein F4778DRAFT_777410 [Xylariomycetidae sp. FL2044]|nr:hypothetical protein F4778DRAFT_777410 [Xylariomycetidae sp. FL2044]
MAAPSLSRRDFNVLEKIKDPESDPATAVIVDPSLPKDPNIIEATVYDRVARKEREIIFMMQQLELQLAGLVPSSVVALVTEPVEDYRKCVEDYKKCVSLLGQLGSEYPGYASARNNRAQALRRLYGDMMLLSGEKDPKALCRDAADLERSQAAATALSDLDRAIALLTPKSLFASVSPQAGKTLSFAHTQRAAIYHITAKALGQSATVQVSDRKEATWAKIDFEEAASRDFAAGGRYGNEIAKGLAVSTNPTAKLCGRMVREAMKKEYGPAFAV